MMIFANLLLIGSFLALAQNSVRASAYLKGFRTPASHWREGMHGGRRPKSLEGGKRGGVRSDAGVGLWGIGRRCLI